VGRPEIFVINESLSGADKKEGNALSTYARTTDAERSETPGGAYMRIPPGRSIPSPSIQSSLSLHGSRNSNDGAAGSFDVQGAQLDGVRKLDVQGAQLDSIESSVNGRSKSSGSVRGNGMGMLGEGTEGMRIALRMLLTNLQSVSACKFKGFVFLCVLQPDTHLRSNVATGACAN
jgi:hypothetical protein